MRILLTLEPDAVIDLSVDEEGNWFGDISPEIGQKTLLDGRRVYSLFPTNSEDPYGRYREYEEVLRELGEL